MKKILLVDDDVTIRELYRQKFVREGFEVDTAENGLVAAQMLRASKPDLVVLDLMMPQLSGVDVLKFIRSSRAIANTPVIIFTNTFLADLGESATKLGIQRAVTKGECSPNELVAIIQEVLASETTADQPSAPPPQLEPKAKPVEPADPSQKVRQQFLQSAPTTLSLLRQLYQDFDQCEDPAALGLRLNDFYRKVHFVSSLAGMAGCHRIAFLGGAFEALLFELQRRPDHIDASTSHTITAAMDFLEVLFDDARNFSADALPPAQVLIIDDDPLSNHLAVAALRNARLEAHAADDPLVGLELLRQRRYDLILLDIEMPHMNGFDVCRKLRTYSGYANTPVIYVTAHHDFECRASGALAGGNDFIAKPIFPLELALKAVMHLIKSQLG
jgi:DNA-binding response OmpR family regulator